MDFKSQDPKLTQAIDSYKADPYQIIEFLKKGYLLIGLIVEKSEKKLVLSDNKEFKALACFSTQKQLSEFSFKARPSILPGREIAEFALKSETRLLHLDPPFGIVISGSILKAVVSDQEWSDPAQNQALISILSQQLDKHPGVEFTLTLGDWTDLKIVLSGDFENCTKAASQLGHYLSRDPKVIDLLPSGADIVYSS